MPPSQELPSIPQINHELKKEVRQRLDSRVKPPGSLGRLETLSISLAGIVGHMDWLPVRKGVFVFAGDHGVVVQGVSTVPQDMTAFMVRQFLKGGAAVNVLSRQMGAFLVVVDAGVNARLPIRPLPLSPTDRMRDRHTQAELIINSKVGYGTADFTRGPAMSQEQADQAVQAGIDAVNAHINLGLDVAAIGEVGIGNTISASAIIAAITGADPPIATGRDDKALEHSHEVVMRALDVNAPADVDTLAKFGGYEIGAMAGAMLAAAAARVPVVVDGLVSAAAALIAARLSPDVVNYMLTLRSQTNRLQGI